MINGDMTMVNSTSSCQRRNVESLLCKIKKLIVLSYGFVYSPTSWLTISQTNIRGEISHIPTSIPPIYVTQVQIGHHPKR